MSQSGPAPTPSSPLHMAPPLRRRLACFIYEGVLLFGVVMLAGLLFSSLTQQRHALQGRHELQAFMFGVLALYFVWFWSHGGQTLAMKTWRIRLVNLRGEPVGYGRASLRFVCSWVWFLPSLGASWLFSWQGKGVLFGAMLAWVLLYAGLALLHPRRQYWHDVLCQTQLLHSEPVPVRPRPATARR
ncbi:RDD family protein [Caldimonas brevitalea]|uniref:Transmembrane protein n=1 Tax=Caldimonas brevitalea TaxID=413882 RepID=A0A0G3BPI8_9BURK|nr:RDD family protein [Caldimonas brevitalea]AKJ28490.1 transmembrane protein [Caldimonas brevitalea]